MSRLDALLAFDFPTLVHRYGTRDTILYALGCGAEAEDLDLVYEPGLIALPSMAATLAYPGNWYARPDCPIDAPLVVHGSERVELAAPLPVAAEVTAKPAIVSVTDKGAGRGALVVSRREVRDTATGLPVCTVTQRAFCRGDGGIGSFGEAPPPGAALPSRDPDRTVTLPTSPRAAAIYRLMGDDNPLHIDPGFARSAGFDRPVLHGLATYGHIARALLRDAPGAWVRVMDCRFTAPVFPGDTLTLDLWDMLEGRAFRARVGPRVVIDNGDAIFGPG